MRAAAVAAALQAALLIAGPLVAHAADSESKRYQALGTLEREAVDDALSARGLQIDLQPEGKTVGTIHVVNHEVFSARDGYLRLANLIHRTTREQIIRREVLVAPGARYDEILVEETVRNLRDADFSSLVAILPVNATEPGKVDLLVVTRDVWSLRFNTDFDYQENVLVFLTTSLSENNLFGWRKKASLGFNLFRGSYSYGPSYQDSNVAGTRLTFSASYVRIHDRETDRQEGSSVGARVDYPLYSLASRWGAGLSAGNSEGVARRYDRRGLRVVDLPGTPETEMLPYIYRVRSSSVGASVVRSFGQQVIQRVSAGYSFSVVRPDFHESFPTDDPTVREAFAAEVFPRSERLSSVFTGYSLFTPRYRVYRDFETYDLREDVQLGPGLSLSVSHSPRWLGSENEYVGLGASVGWSFDRWDGYQRLSTSWGGRIRAGRLVDESRSASGAFVTPIAGRDRPGGSRGEHERADQQHPPRCLPEPRRRQRSTRLRNRRLPGRRPISRPPRAAHSPRADQGPALRRGGLLRRGPRRCPFCRPARLPRRRSGCTPADPPAQLLRPAHRLGRPLPARPLHPRRPPGENLRGFPPGVLGL